MNRAKRLVSDGASVRPPVVLSAVAVPDCGSWPLSGLQSVATVLSGNPLHGAVRAPERPLRGLQRGVWVPVVARRRSVQLPGGGRSGLRSRSPGGILRGMGITAGLGARRARRGCGRGWPVRGGPLLEFLAVRHLVVLATIAPFGLVYVSARGYGYGEAARDLAAVLPGVRLVLAEGREPSASLVDPLLPPRLRPAPGVGAYVLGGRGVRRLGGATVPPGACERGDGARAWLEPRCAGGHRVGRAAGEPRA